MATHQVLRLPTVKHNYWYQHYKVQRTTIRYGLYYDYVMQRFNVIMNRTMQHCNYVTATLHYATLLFLQRTVMMYKVKFEYLIIHTVVDQRDGS